MEDSEDVFEEGDGELVRAGMKALYERDPDMFWIMMRQMIPPRFNGRVKIGDTITVKRPARFGR